MKITHGNATRIAAVIYTSGSLIAAGVFLIVTSLADYEWVARLGGALWVFLLSMIILMPTVTPWLHGRAGGQVERPAHH
jgi:hypothetical protein